MAVYFIPIALGPTKPRGSKLEDGHSAMVTAMMAADLNFEASSCLQFSGPCWHPSSQVLVPNAAVGGPSHEAPSSWKLSDGDASSVLLQSVLRYSVFGSSPAAFTAELGGQRKIRCEVLA